MFAKLNCGMWFEICVLIKKNMELVNHQKKLQIKKKKKKG